MDIGYKIVYDNKPYTVADETDYFAVYKDYEHVASFKTKDLAFHYCEYMRKY